MERGKSQVSLLRKNEKCAHSLKILARSLLLPPYFVFIKTFFVLL
jgi:hypothetical protein